MDPQVREWLEQFLDQSFAASEGESIPQPSVPPTKEAIRSIQTLLDNYENIVRAAIKYTDEDLCLIDPSYEGVVQSKVKEDATYVALVEDARELENRIKECSDAISSLESQYAEIRDAHQLSHSYQFIVNQLREDRSGLKIDELTDTIHTQGLRIMPQSLIMINRISFELSEEQSATAASTDKLDRTDSPTILYLRRIKHERIRNYHASIQGISVRIQNKKILLTDLTSKYEVRARDIMESKNRVTELVEQIRKKKQSILAEPVNVEEKSSRESYFDAYLRDVGAARSEYGLEGSPPRVDQPKPITAVTTTKKKKKYTRKTGKPKDEEIALEAISTLGGSDGSITTKQLLEYANNTYPDWQEGRNINRSDQAARSMRSSLYKIAEIVPGTDRYRLRPEFTRLN